MTKKQRSRRRRLGLWLVGVRGGLATTVYVGARAVARGLASSSGLLTQTELFAGFPFVELGDLVFGGHDVRELTTREAALEVAADSGTLPPALLDALGPDLRRLDREVRRGTVRGAGRAITELADPGARRDRRKLASIVRALRKDLADFRERHGVERVVVVNLGSTEPPLRLTKAHKSLAALDRAVASDSVASIRPSTLYAYAAAAEGCPFIHFTPSNATLVPAVRELFDATATPYVGKDGKTGETLVKSALAPMFKYRNLRVLSWQGYNLLGDRDGAVLDDPTNKRSKIRTKDALLHRILGYPLHSKVGIDYVPSLGDRKTAWDFIHFAGFLDFKMSMQFTWHGCDAILAAPLVLDMARLVDYMACIGRTGPLVELACFFKSPIGIDENDLHRQWHMLEAFAKQQRVRLGIG